mmetsp:Transcript_28567/g.66189  ORF Transcript_28567/g.66189 Transcript_28567/m.66189 type:complete len:581 (-) Transcript_28567:46-1788(-)|eukprot:CAMPEP_0178411580 /NCGR_PEP_ID=MMETSP0689_2-20121128/21565_1 /TAXON_ID=160604 /ORGANISM="Amphidinium massartii, Strain CS-259" /LENGTH=580 /DNA_ID=CAMNT_0020032785 /DNA_START=26 /DNA_END=1768 /DNA_ORIENTATION=-
MAMGRPIQPPGGLRRISSTGSGAGQSVPRSDSVKNAPWRTDSQAAPWAAMPQGGGDTQRVIRPPQSMLALPHSQKAPLRRWQYRDVYSMKQDSPFIYQDILQDIKGIEHHERPASLKMSREVEKRLTGRAFNTWLQNHPVGSENFVILQDTLNEHLWTFSKAQRLNLLAELTSVGFDFVDWQVSPDGNVRAGRSPQRAASAGRGGNEWSGPITPVGIAPGKGRIAKGKGKGGKGKRRSKRVKEEEDGSGKTGANTIEVDWKPPTGDGDDSLELEEEEEEAWEGDAAMDNEEELLPPRKVAKKEKSPSPVRGPAGRGSQNAVPAWMTSGIGNTPASTTALEALPGAGRGRGNGGGGRGDPSIPAEDKLGSVFEERDASLADEIMESGAHASQASQGRRSRGEKDRYHGDKWKGREDNEWNGDWNGINKSHGWRDDHRGRTWSKDEHDWSNSRDDRQWNRRDDRWNGSRSWRENDDRGSAEESLMEEQEPTQDWHDDPPAEAPMPSPAAACRPKASSCSQAPPSSKALPPMMQQPFRGSSGPWMPPPQSPTMLAALAHEDFASEAEDVRAASRDVQVDDDDL